MMLDLIQRLQSQMGQQSFFPQTLISLRVELCVSVPSPLGEMKNWSPGC